MSQLLTALPRAAYKRTLAFVRSLGVLSLHPRWQDRAQICAACPMAVTADKTITCGKPFLRQIARRPEEGCGCPVLEKAKDPAEHCPVDRTLSARAVAIPRPGDATLRSGNFTPQPSTALLGTASSGTPRPNTALLGTPRSGVTRTGSAAQIGGTATCNCKWCSAGLGPTRP